MKKIKIRQAYINTEFRAIQEENKLILEGYFIRFNEYTELEDGYFEQVSPDALKNFETNDIVCLFNHDSGKVLGRVSNKTLTLEADKVGLKGIVTINLDDAEAVSIYYRVKRGDIKGCSFGFRVLSQEIESGDDGIYRVTLTNIDLFEVSVVTFPAYPTTEISARMEDIEKYKKDKLRIKKDKLKERLNA